MKDMHRSAVAWGFLCAAVLGCGPSGPPMHSVEGSVTYNGKPLETGVITLVPTGNEGRSASGDISSGQYSISALAGAYQVKIQATEEYGPVVEGMGQRAKRQIIPPKYNSQTTLSANVPLESESLDFDISSAKQ